ncbi:hypothetical protein [Catenulispora subtropica]|uniref:Uncharacterized protein n=1 Tax=Catenulispora subtropica TaxID=450798 RepID=A0ABN2T9S4_9ACTN
MIPSPSPAFPSRRTLWQRVLRVVWASFPVWSVGFLAWVPSLQLAIDRQGRKAWAVFAGFAAGEAAAIWIDIATSETKADKTIVATWPGVLCMLTLMVAPTVHYCLATRGPQPPYQAVQTQPYTGPYTSPEVSPEQVQAGLRELRGILARREEP